MTSVAVLCHADDESMWVGGLIAAQPGNWTIICCTVPRTDPIRAWKFFDACEVLGAKPKLFPRTEPEPGQPISTQSLDQINLEGYDRIVTHGTEGEYGHAQHKALSAYIHSKWAHKEIWSCCPPGKSDYDTELKLTDAQLNQKISAIMRYDHVLPYEGVLMPKSAALIKRYCHDGGWPLNVERYRIHRPI